VPLSLDRACDVGFDAKALAEAKALADLGLRFMRLPAEAMVAAAGQGEAHADPEFGVRDFASALRREGIRLIAEHVEHEEAVPVLIDLSVPLAQGFVFAAPRAVKAEVFEEAASPDDDSSPYPALLRYAG
jgi:cyclic-di-GMP phosphodiesterase TipF (flagellum assembly factor)